MRVLVVDDERAVRESLRRALELEGYDVELAADGREALGRLEAGPDPDAVILDVLMPEVDGLEVCEELRRSGSRLPVLMLTARAEVENRVAGLDAGADDYMAKPFALAELSARLRALLRRGTPRESVLRVADLEMDTIRRTVRRAGSTIELKPKEYALLEFLMRNSDRPLTRSLIIEHVWDIHFDSVSNVVEVHINSLRNKIDRGFPVQLIQTVRGVGYMLTDSAP
jgi:two-component system, OmpR family, response regulator MprA